jgi:phosphoglucan,water dikinase
MAEKPSVRIGSQTAFSAIPLTAPFEYAVHNGFDAFEWFPDKKESGAGWSETDISAEMREYIRKTALDRDMRLSVHAPWPSNPLKAEKHFASAVSFTQDIGARLFNVHLDVTDGIDSYVQAVTPLLDMMSGTRLLLSFENTPQTTPGDFNALFVLLRKYGLNDPGKVGMCLDLGHANLCAQTRNDYLRYIDLLGPEVPIVHVHLHENYGDADIHLPLFTGPSARDDSGIRGFLKRLRERGFAGSIILEQWPDPPSLLTEARRRLLELIEAQAVVTPDEKSLIVEHKISWDRVSHEAGESGDFAAMIVSADKQYKSWRKKLAWIQGLFEDKDFEFTDERLAYLAVYLRFIGTGRVPMGEDGGHYRPSHHAQIARHIYERLRKIENTDNAFIIRKIYPWLPSFDTPFMRAEPLTRIRDIAHRNDIPRELKEEIKHTLQNKLHRSAGPEDLAVSQELLERITAPGAAYPDAFVEEFRKFHEELKEFFNARSITEQLKAIADRQEKELITKFLRIKDKTSSAKEMITTFSVLTDLRRRFGEQMHRDVTAEAQALQSADIMLEDFSFALLSALINDLTRSKESLQWEAALDCLALSVENLRMSGFDEEECTAIKNEINAWSLDFDAGDRLKLLRLKATSERAWRLAEGYAGRILQLFPEIASQLGHALGVAEDSIRVFGEAVIRAHPVFQLSKLVSFILGKIRLLAALPSWDIIVPGRATGYLTQGEVIEDLTAPAEKPLLALLKRVEGDEEIPANVRAILSEEETPLLSHLAVRARQRGVAFAVCEDAEVLQDLKRFAGSRLLLDLSNNRVSFRTWEEADEPVERHRRVIPPEVVLSSAKKLLPLAEVRPETGGSKACGAARLEELRASGKSDFHTPPACVIPFGVMEESLRLRPALAGEYADMLRRLGDPKDIGFSASIERLRDILLLGVPDDIISGVKELFGGHTRLMVRSSSNLEDREELSGAGLYDSIANVAPQNVAGAIQKVWASLWTRRAALGRMISGIPHEKAHMAVLIQQMIAPEYSFIMHTENPINARADEVYIEIAVGLGETLASGGIPGLPYRMTYNRHSAKVQVISFASFSKAVVAGKTGKTEEITIDYSSVRLSVDDTFRNLLVAQIGKIGAFVEESFGGPQDIEGVVTGDKIYLVQSRPQQGNRRRHDSPAPCRVMGLFQKRIEGDDALLSLAQLRFRRARLGAEYYAETPEELEGLLKFSLSEEAMAIVHLARGIDIFRDEDTKRVVDFSRRLGKNIYGMVLHDQEEIISRLKDYAALLRRLDADIGKNGRYLFIEYASGLAPDIFFGLFEEISSIDHVSCCIDTGHLGLHCVRTAFASRRRGKDIFSIKPDDPSLSLYLDDIQASVETALDGVLSLIRKLAALGKPLHFHLHDGHPLSVVSPFGVSDHLSFLDKIPIPIQYEGENVLAPMFGASGLSSIVQEALAIGKEKVSFTVEIHPAEGKLPLSDAAHLFDHWKDKGNAERMNHWLSAIIDNSRLVMGACGNER